MFLGSSRLKLDNMKLYTMLQEVDIDKVSNFFNISIKNKVQYKFLVSFYLFVFHESIGESELVNLSTSYS